MTIDDGIRTFAFLQLAAWGFYGLATFLTFLSVAEPEGIERLFLFKGVVRPTVGILTSSALALGYRRLDDEPRSGSAVAGAAVAGALVGGATWYLGSSLLMRALRRVDGPLVVWENVPHGIIEYVFVMAAWSAAFFGIRAWRRSRHRERQALEAETRASEARLEMLASQLDPHFLFNALSSLRGLVRRDPERAERTVTRLAEFLRYALDHRATATVTLGDELAMIQAYLEVERGRLGDRLDVRVDIDPGAERSPVPAFLLHPLVENAIKHGGSDDHVVRVEIRARLENGRVDIEVANPGSVRPSSRGPGIGLQNVRERLGCAHPGHRFALFEEDGWVKARIELDRGGDDGGPGA